MKSGAASSSSSSSSSSLSMRCLWSLTLLFVLSTLAPPTLAQTPFDCYHGADETAYECTSFAACRAQGGWAAPLENRKDDARCFDTTPPAEPRVCCVKVACSETFDHGGAEGPRAVEGRCMSLAQCEDERSATSLPGFFSTVPRPGSPCPAGADIGCCFHDTCRADRDACLVADRCTSHFAGRVIAGNAECLPHLACCALGPPPTPEPTPEPPTPEPSPMPVHIDESNGLRALYSATNGKHWRCYTDPLLPPCTGWQPLSTPRSGHVDPCFPKATEWSDHDATAELCTAHTITHLDLDDNSLDGTLPTLVGGMTHLRVLTARFNSLNGTLPSELGQLTRLTTLALASNALEADEHSVALRDLRHLTQLETLELYANRLSGALPPQWSALTRLRRLFVGVNSLHGTLPSQWAAMRELRELSLRDNELLSSVPSELGTLTHLEQLYLQENALSHHLPPELFGAHMRALRDVRVSANALDGELPTSIGELAALHFFYANNNSFVGAVPSEFGALSQLRVLDLAANSLDGALPSHLAAARNLTTLRLQRNALTGTVPHQLGKLSLLTHLRLDQNSLSGIVPVDLASAPLTSECDLRGNAFDCVPRELASRCVFTAPQCNEDGTAPSHSSSSSSSSSSSGLSTGALIGIIIGGVFGVCLCVSLLVVCARRSSSSSRPRNFVSEGFESSDPVSQQHAPMQYAAGGNTTPLQSFAASTTSDRRPTPMALRQPADVIYE